MISHYYVANAVFYLIFFFGYCCPLTSSSEILSLSCPLIEQTTANDDPRLDTIDPIKRVSDTSGIVFSQTQTSPTSNAPIIFGLGDKGDGNRIFVWDSSTGERLLTLHFDRHIFPNDTDWEDITLGSCGIPLQHEEPSTTTTTTSYSRHSCLYIGDFGSNTAGNSGGRRDGREGIPTRIIKVVEPTISDFVDQDVIPLSYYSILEFDYLHESSPTQYANCETMFIDHTGWGSSSRSSSDGTSSSIGDIYLVTKWGGNRGNPNADLYTKTRLFKIPANVWPTSSSCADIVSYSPEAVGEYELNRTLIVPERPVEDDGEGDGENGDNTGNNDDDDAYEPYYEVTGGQLFGQEWRSGDMSCDGTMIGLGTRDHAYIFLRCPGQSVADTLAAPDASTRYCLQWEHPTGKMVESFAFTPDNQQSLEVPEGHRPRLGWTRLLSLSQPQPGSRCPPTEVDNENYPMYFTPPSRDILEAILCVPVPTISPFSSIATTEIPTSSPTTASPPSTQPSRVIVTDEPTLRPTSRPTAATTTSNTNSLTTTAIPTTIPDVSPTATVTTTIQPTMSIDENNDGEDEEMTSNAAPATATYCSCFVLLYVLYYSFFH